jgi:hypothetical protein
LAFTTAKGSGAPKTLPATGGVLRCVRESDGLSDKRGYPFSDNIEAIQSLPEKEIPLENNLRCIPSQKFHEEEF